MPLILCPMCVGWVDSGNRICSDCHARIELDQPDPPADVLRNMIGLAIGSLGAVRVSRNLRPNWGVLAGTESGFCFLPKITHPTEHVVAAGYVETSESWLFGMWRRLIDRRKTSLLESFPTETQPGSSSLADRLMESPGAFFVVRESIQKLIVYDDELRIERAPGCVLRIRLLGSRESVQHGLAKIMANGEWSRLFRFHNPKFPFPRFDPR